MQGQFIVFSENFSNIKWKQMRMVTGKNKSEETFVCEYNYNCVMSEFWV